MTITTTWGGIAPVGYAVRCGPWLLNADGLFGPGARHWRARRFGRVAYRWLLPLVRHFARQ